MTTLSGDLGSVGMAKCCISTFTYLVFCAVFLDLGNGGVEGLEGGGGGAREEGRDAGRDGPLDGRKQSEERSRWGG